MSSEIKILTQYEINKSILDKPIEQRPDDDLTGPYGKYSDELHQIYTQKREEFFEAARQYNKLNEEAIFSSEERLSEDYLEMLYCPFLETLSLGVSQQKKFTLRL